MANDFETIFAAWPFRYFVINNNKFVKIGIPENSEFDVSLLEKCL